MKKETKILITLLMAMMMALCMTACQQAAAEEETSFSGELIDARASQLVVRGESATMQFTASPETEYSYSGERELYVGDEIKVEYHEENGRFMADKIHVTEHQEKLLVFGGEVTDLTDAKVTVRTESLSVRFDYDAETLVEGNLSKGDIVAITYRGDLSEKPYAVSIVVTENLREEALTTINGTVAEMGDWNLLVSVDSADAYRFEITGDTIIRGSNSKIKVGDRVSIVYTGNINENPLARSITVTREKDRRYFVIDGSICGTTLGSVSINTGEKKYSFSVDDETKITNREYLKAYHIVTVTYTGKLNKKPHAVAIYCSKDQEKVDQKKETKKKSSKPKKPTKDEPTETDPTETEPTATEPTETEPTATEPTETEPTETEPTATEPTETEPAETEPSEDPIDTDPTEDLTDEIETEPEFTDPLPEPEPEEPENTADDRVIVNADGTIRSWGTTCEIKVEGGSTLVLDASDASISSGYFPQAEDQVIIAYDESDLKLLDIQLVYRPAEAEEAPEE